MDINELLLMDVVYDMIDLMVWCGERLFIFFSSEGKGQGFFCSGWVL